MNNLQTYFRESGGNFTTIPQVNYEKTFMRIAKFFKENNYTSISVGKIFHRTAAASGPGDTSLIWLLFLFARTDPIIWQ